MINGKTETGFEFSVKKDAMNDMEVVDAIAKSSMGDKFEKLTAVSILCDKMLGSDKKRLYDHVRKEDGRVPIDDLEKELVNILKALGEQGKNC